MRSRNIKPAFFKNEILAECEPLVRTLFIGLWCYADREGRLEDRPKRIKAEILPYDPFEISLGLSELAEKNFITRYDINGKNYIQINNFFKHQSPHYLENPSIIPPPKGHNDSLTKVSPLKRSEKQVILKRDTKCLRCGSTVKLQVDHIIPKSMGGTNDPSNLQVLCISCNASKRNKVRSETYVIPNKSSSGHQSDVSLKSDSLRPPDSLIPDSLNTSLRKEVSKAADLEKEIEDVKKEISQLVKRDIFNPYEFDKKNERKHPKARLQVLTRAKQEIEKGNQDFLKDPWRLLTHILTVEHQNANERGGIKEHEARKLEEADFAKMIDGRK